MRAIYGITPDKEFYGMISHIAFPGKTYDGRKIVFSQYIEKRSLVSLCVLSGEITDTKISAENLFSLPICVIMGPTKSLPCVKGGGSRRLTEGL